jgi:hypothetical protein
MSSRIKIAQHRKPSPRSIMTVQKVNEPPKHQKINSIDMEAINVSATPAKINLVPKTRSRNITEKKKFLTTLGSSNNHSSQKPD